MQKARIETYSRMAQPEDRQKNMVNDLKRHSAFRRPAGCGIDAGDNRECLADGVVITGDSAGVDTALESLRRLLAEKNVKVSDSGKFRIKLCRDLKLGREEFTATVTRTDCLLCAADADGMRRAIYFLEDRVAETEGRAVSGGNWRRSAYVRHRISRCFFGPTYRPPFYVDELTNEIDYYPDEYLNKLAHDGVNGLWLTMYFADFPSPLFPGRGKDCARRLEKLRRTVEKCGRYGIRIYVFFCEPKFYGDSDYARPLSEAAHAPGTVGMSTEDPAFKCFCTSSEEGKQYMREAVERLFAAVPELGGVIDIMFGEDNGACAQYMLHTDMAGDCPHCSSRNPVDIICENAAMMADAMHKYSPAAEFIGWFYAPEQRDHLELMRRLKKVSERWPDNCTLMFNMESGAAVEQLGKSRNVFDYSLACVKASELFKYTAKTAPHFGAKIQVGCSHENASIPFMPVPLNLYDKYHYLHETGCDTVMQCWYFGNYPGLMNKAAGLLSFDPFPEDGMAFMAELARPEWGRFAATAAAAWREFSLGYREFPVNLSFEWYGPLHQAIAWPWHLMPVDEPIMPSWILKNFPEVSGDRIGECIGFQHTMDEALILCRRMRDKWRAGMALLSPLRREFASDPARLLDIGLAEAVGLQMESTCNALEFYQLREDMLFAGNDNLAAMRQLTENELKNSQRMLELCESDVRLGYHSEAEGYHFFPDKLRERMALLRELLAVDFPAFRADAPELAAYTGRHLTGAVAAAVRYGEKLQPNKFKNGSWSVDFDDDSITVHLHNLADCDLVVDIEPCRLWPPLRLSLSKDGKFSFSSMICREVPDIKMTGGKDERAIRVPQDIFHGIRRPGVPMRINVRSGSDSWAGGINWTPRLLHCDYNPANMGWLIEK